MQGAAKGMSGLLMNICSMLGKQMLLDIMSHYMFLVVSPVVKWHSISSCHATHTP